MLEALDCKVVRLRRVRIAGLRLGDLPSGKWRRLSAQEVVEKLGRHRAKSEVRSEIAEDRRAGSGDR
jgi:16S rRNA U516 pseudouridylate synthase RsuA-like enzyme